MNHDKLKAAEKQIFVENATKLATSRSCLMIVVGPNDSMKSKVQNILDTYQRGGVLLAGRADGIPKLIAVAEVAKQKLQESGSQFHQLNKSDKQISYINPKRQAASTDDQTAALKAAIAEVRGHKTYTLPILYIWLSPNSEPVNGSTSGWTEQTV